MAHTYTNLWMHVIFSTKDRERLLDAAVKPRLFAYMASIIENQEGQPLLVNGPSDHVHMLFVLPANLSLAELVRKVKANSSRWVHQNCPALGGFVAWQAGYAGFSVSASKVGEVKRYIANQEQHHRHVTFQEEVLAFLKRHGIQYDVRFVFDWRIRLCRPWRGSGQKRDVSGSHGSRRGLMCDAPAGA
jgi:putative transposase